MVPISIGKSGCTVGLHPAFFTITIVGWVFAAAGVLYNDQNVRDIGLLVAIGSLAIGLLIDASPIRVLRREFRREEAYEAAPAARDSGARSRFRLLRAPPRETAFEQVLDSTATSPRADAIPSRTASPAEGRAPPAVVAQWARPGNSWERPSGTYATAAQPAAAVSGARLAYGNANGSGPASPRPMAGGASALVTVVPDQVPTLQEERASGAERMMRGICGKCRSPIMVSNRRPLRVTCPVCGNTKILQ
jgi:ribosomal protein S27E